jgi:hypothetical protein
MGGQEIRDLLHQRHVSFSEVRRMSACGTIEESNSQCKLWFDDKLILPKKRKIFVGE